MSTAIEHLTPPIPFPLPNFDKVTVVFGADGKDYLTKDQLGEWYGCYGENSDTPFHKAAEGFFSSGGKLADYGLTIKEGIDATRAMNAIRALLGSWAPKHEIKIGTVAVALANWCDYLPAKNGSVSP